MASLKIKLKGNGCHTPDKSISPMLISLPQPLSPQVNVPQFLYQVTHWRCEASHTALPLPLG